MDPPPTAEEAAASAQDALAAQALAAGAATGDAAASGVPAGAPKTPLRAHTLDTLIRLHFPSDSDRAVVMLTAAAGTVNGKGGITEAPEAVRLTVCDRGAHDAWERPEPGRYDRRTAGARLCP